MDYEKKYKEALEKARKIKRKIMSSHLSTESCKAVSEYIDTIIPELRESEDKRIRKWLVDYFSSIKETVWIHRDITCEQILAYLEKQKEPIPIPNKFSGLKSLMLQYLQSAANRKDDTEIESDTDLFGRKILDYVWKYDEKHKEQKDLFKDGIGHYFYDGNNVHFCSAPAMEARELDDSNESVEHWQYVGEVDLEKEKAIEILEDYLKWAVSELEEDCSYTWNELANAIKLGICAMKEQKPNIELIQKSWYMEGYHDREYNKEPKWIIKTGEGGPKYEENPKYGKFIEQKQVDEQFPPLEGLDAIKAKYYDDGFKNGFDEGVESIKTAEWSEEDEEILDGIINTLDRLGYAEFCKSSREEDIEEERFYYKEIQCLKKLKSLRPQPNTVSVENAIKFGNLEYERGVKDGIQSEKSRHWKPSEKQMEALEKAIIKAHSTDEIPILTELRQQLKKL